jgi:hypothetical protein
MEHKKFFIVEQDLRISGTSQGIISRSFISKLRISYPDAIIDVLYLKSNSSDDQLHLLPVNAIEVKIVAMKIPFFIKVINWAYWRIFHVSLNERYIHSQYRKEIAKVSYQKYDHVFIRSAGLAHEVILGTRNLPILKKAIVNFHDPYPTFWYPGNTKALTKLDLYRFLDMLAVVKDAKTCTSSSFHMSADLTSLYGTKKFFLTLPHQFSAKVFDFSDKVNVLKKQKKVRISYHGAIMFGRNIEVLLDAYKSLLDENPAFLDDTEFILRMKGGNVVYLKDKFSKYPNIQFLDLLNFANSSNEQMHETSINIILENGPLYSNTLVGKAPFLDCIGKRYFILAPQKSELRSLLRENQCVAHYDNPLEMKQKLKDLINNEIQNIPYIAPLQHFYSDENFKVLLDEILVNNTKL